MKRGKMLQDHGDSWRRKYGRHDLGEYYDDDNIKKM
jgi:hypothetical protein